MKVSRREGDGVRLENEKYGLWWLPTFPECKVKGSLTWSHENGGTLQLQSSFPDPVMKELENAPIKPYIAPIILGESDRGLQYTLYENLATTLGSQPRFHSAYLMEGAHFQLISDVLASHVSFGMRHLEEWTHETPIERTDDRFNENPFRLKLKPVSQPLSPTRLLNSDISQPRSATLSVSATYNPKFGFKQFVFEQKARILIHTSEKPFGFDELLSSVHDCSTLFTLLMAEDAGVFDLWFWLQTNEQAFPLRRIRLLYMGLKDPSPSEIHPDDMLLALSHLPNASTVISLWMDEAPKLRRSANWLISSTRIRSYSDTEFLNYIQAAESLHRVLMPPGQFIDPGDYSKIAKTIVSAIPLETRNDLKQKLKTMLVYGNEFSLRRRICDLLETIYPAEKSTVAKVYKNWIDRIVETRNYLIHNDPQSASRAAEGQQFFELTQGLKGLVTTVLLQHVGVPRQAALNAVTWRGWAIKL